MPKLQKDTLFEVNGFVMLKRLENGNTYKVTGLEEVNGFPVYRIRKVNKRNRLSTMTIRHYVKDVDLWVNTGNNNQIVIL